MMAAVLPPDEPKLRRRFVTWSRVCLVLLIVADVGELLVRSQSMAGGDLASALAAAPLVMTRTHFGTVWMWRAAVIVPLFLLMGATGRAAHLATCGLALGVALTTTLVGHAADQGDLSLAALVDWIHISAAAAWTGGLLCLAGLVLREVRQWQHEPLAMLLRRFSSLAGWCLLAVVASGIYNACTRLGSLSALWTSAYGKVLIAKLALVLVVAVLGAANRFAVLPRLGAMRSRSARAEERLVSYVFWEAALVVLIFGCTALLTESTPPRHLHEAVSGHPALATALCRQGCGSIDSLQQPQPPTCQWESYDPVATEQAPALRHRRQSSE